DAVTITGPGATNLIISAQNASRVFSVNVPNVVANVTITGMTITGGRISPNNVVDTTGDGAGIFTSNENVVLDGVVVSGNVDAATTADSGGGIGVDSGGLLTVRNSV